MKSQSKVSNFFTNEITKSIKAFSPLMCIIRHSVFLLISLAFPLKCQASLHSDISLYQDSILFGMLDLKINTATKLLLNNNKVEDQSNIYNEYLGNWIEVVDVVIKENEQAYEIYNEKLERRLERIDNWPNKKETSFRILKAEIYAHAAMANIVYGDYIAGIKKLLKANKYSKENIALYPEYFLNKKLVGVLNVSLDMMSPLLKKIAKLFGLVGNTDKGFEQLNSYLIAVRDYPGLKSEALLYYGFALKLAKRDEEAYHLFKSELKPDQAPAMTLLLASNIIYLSGRNEEALGLVNAIENDKFEVPFNHKDYLLGKIKLNHLQTDASKYLELFLENSKVKNFNREICSKLSQHYYMHGNTDKFHYYREKIDSYPTATTDRDREADVELERPYLPHKDLLKARYLLSGGYYLEADIISKGITSETLTIPAYKTEYLLQKAKIEEYNKHYQQAISLYIQAISHGRNNDEHYTAEAALCLGDLYLRQGDKTKAEKYWKEAIDNKGQKDVYFEQIDKLAKHKLSIISHN